MQRLIVLVMLVVLIVMAGCAGARSALLGTSGMKFLQVETGMTETEFNEACKNTWPPVRLSGTSRVSDGIIDTYLQKFATSRIHHYTAIYWKINANDEMYVHNYRTWSY